MPRSPRRRLAVLALLLTLPALAIDAPGRAPDVGTSYRVPYRTTETNHFLVRVRIDGKGPFNFLVDTGAPALFVGTEAAKKIGIVATDDEFFTPIGRLDFEGGASLTGMKARIEDPFQMVGMNALGLPGASIDGILGFTALARFKIEIDPTRDRMVWTRLDYDPKDPVIPKAAQRGAPSAEMQAMSTLGPIAKFAAAIVGKQPAEQLHPRGFVGVELAEAADAPKVVAVLADSPALAAGIKPGDLPHPRPGAGRHLARRRPRRAGRGPGRRRGRPDPQSRRRPPVDHPDRRRRILTAHDPLDSEEFGLPVPVERRAGRPAGRRGVVARAPRPGGAGPGPGAGGRLEAGPTGRRAVRPRRIEPHGRPGQGERPGAVPPGVRPRGADHAAGEQGGRGLGRDRQGRPEDRS